MDDYISKPVDAGVFMRALDKWAPHKGDALHVEALPVVTTESYAPIDMEHLKAFTDGDRETEAELFAMFLEQADIDMVHLEEALKNGDAETWRKAAHKFKGASANLGARALSEICAHAERGAEEDTPTEKAACLASLRTSYIEVRRFIDKQTGA
jgi:HPt (histidine-containing phosphotransfer) domain-containing protein